MRAMLNHNIAAKALLINKEGEVLCLRRRPDDVHNPSTWDFPGGRLDEGESPFDGLKRECNEEVALDIEIVHPINIHHFTRQDGQHITMMCFLCKVAGSGQEIKLSEEHTEYKWLPAEQARETMHEAFQPDIDNYIKYFKSII